MRLTMGLDPCELVVGVRMATEAPASKPVETRADLGAGRPSPIVVNCCEAASRVGGLLPIGCNYARQLLHST